MRSIALILFNFIVLLAAAQTGTDILFTKGAELEYRTFSTRLKGLKMETYEVTRITLIVTDVIDSNRITYSYITKKGTGIAKPEIDHYEKEYIITREAGKTTIPFDLYLTETTYLADKYSRDKKAKGYNVISNSRDDCNITANMEKGLFDYTPRTLTMDIKVRDYSMTKDISPTAAARDYYQVLSETRYAVTATVTDLVIEGKTKITTAAGTFDCYKIIVTGEAKLTGHKFETTSTIYYSPGIGYIKTEQGDEESQAGNIELVRIKR